MRRVVALCFVQPQREINPTAFRDAWQEWKFCQADQRLHMGLINDLSCPACSEGLGAVHIDANMKLFTWQRHREKWRLPHYSFFLPDTQVEDTLRAVDKAVGTQVGW